MLGVGGDTVTKMRLGSSPWLRAVFLATALIFTAVAVYIFALRFFGWLESDASVPALLAARTLHTGAPIADDWYYANGDLWVLAPHLLAVLPIAILGVGPAALLVANILGFALELVVLVKVYARHSRESWIALFAAMATLMAWSNAHVAYTYIQLAYGFATTLYILSFHLFATLAHDASPRPWRFIVAGLLVAAIAVGNPTRGLVYLVAPILVACAWPWRSFAVRRRLALAATASAGWFVAFAIYTWWLARVVAWSVPRGHLGFVIGGVKQIEANLAMFGRGLVLLCAGGGRSGLWAIPGALLLVGALALVIREAVSRTSTPLRWLSVIVMAQLGVVLVPLLIGNVLDGPEAARYVIPSMLAVVGLAVVIAIRSVGEVVGPWWRRIAVGWLFAVPVAALVAATNTQPPTPVRGIWPDAAELDTIADELVRRGLTHGFADNLSASLLTLDSGGAALTCEITFNDILMPQRWLAGTSCYTASALPDRFYVVAYQDDRERKAIHSTMPSEIERFHVGETYEVHVFRTQDTPLAWLDLPILDRELATFPIRIPATHLQLRHDNVALESGELVATGAPGTVVYGPYLDLPKGEYTATWIGDGIGSTGRITFSVTGAPSGRGRRKLVPQVTLEAHAIPRGRSELVRFAFSAKRPVAGVEVAVESADGGRVSLHELVIERSPAP